MKSSSILKFPKPSWAFLLAALWALFVLVEFILQCPEAWLSFRFSIPQGQIHLSQLLTTWGDLMTLLVTSIWILALMIWTGNRMIKVLGGLSLGPVLSFCVQAGLGIFTWNLFWVGTGLTRLWFTPIWLGVVVLASLAAVPDLMKAVRGFRSLPKVNLPWWLLAIVLLYGVTGLFNALLPETFYDSLNYFLGLPQFWLFHHGMSDNSSQLLSGYFYGGPMYFMGGWLLAQTEGATLFSMAAWGLCGILIYGWAEELSGRKTALVACAATLSFPLLYLNAWAVRVDDLFAFVSLLFVYALTRLLANPPAPERRRWIIMGALFAGLAVSIKPTAVVVIAAAVLVLALRREPGWRERWIPLFFWSSLLGLLSVAPWLVKNWAFAGNPFFPYAFSFMGGRTIWDHGYQRLLWENRQFLTMDHGFWSILDLPWRLVMPDDGDDQMIGPLALAFLPSLFLFKLKEPKRFLLWVTLVSFVLGFTLSHMLRFSMPAFLLAELIATVVLVSEESPMLYQWGWKAAVIGFALFFMGAYAVISAQYYQGWGRWTGQETQSAYLERMIPNSYEPMVLWMDQNLPAQARLLVVGDARGLYYPRDFFANSVFDEPFFAKAAKQEKDAAGILHRLKKKGIDYVVVNGPEGLRLASDYSQYDMTTGQWTKVNDLIARGLKPVYWKNFQAIYQVKDHLSLEKTKPLFNVFSLLSPSAYDFSQAMKKDDKPQARKALKTLLTLFPGEDYWREQLRQVR